MALAGAYLFSNVVGAHAAESAFWKERRNAAQRMQQKSSLSESLPALGLAAEERARAGLTSEQYQMLAQLPKAGQVNFGAVADIPITNGWPGQGLGEKIPAGLKGGQSADDSPSWLSTLILPYGTLRDVYLSPVQNAPLVIHIQDAHEIQEAQKNMAAMIQGLREGRGITLVGLEGASGAFALEPYRSYPNAAVTRGIAEYFLKEGYIGGAEFVGLTAPEPPTLWGVEDLSLYQGNIQAFKDSVRFRADLRAFLKRLKTAADRLKFRVYSNPLKDFDRHFNAYKNRQEGLGDYVRFLMDARQNPRGYPNLYLLLDALEWEESLDFRRVEKERLQLVEVLARELSEAQLNHLVQQSLLYRLGRMGYGDYHRFLRQLCRDNGIRLEDFGQLDSYITYVLLAERINRNELLVELTRLEDDTQAALAATPEQKKMVLVNRNLMLLEKLAGHAMTPVDWHYYDAKRPEVLRVVQDLEQMGQSLGDPLSLDAPQNVPAMLEPFEQFCWRALERNRALVDNLLQKLKEKAGPSSPSVAVLVAGGFHTDGLSQLLRSKDISYVVVTPKISEVPKESKYLDIFAHDPLPLEKLFAGETIYLAAERLLVLDGAQIKFSHTRLSAFRGLYRMFQPALQALFEEAGEDMETLQESLNRQSSEVSAALGEKELRIEIDRDISRRGFYSVLRYSLTAENGAPVRAQLAVMTKDKLAAAKQFLEEEGMRDAVHEAEITVDGETYVLVLFKSSSITDTLAGHWDKLRAWGARMKAAVSREEKPATEVEASGKEVSEEGFLGSVLGAEYALQAPIWEWIYQVPILNVVAHNVLNLLYHVGLIQARPDQVPWWKQALSLAAGIWFGAALLSGASLLWLPFLAFTWFSGSLFGEAHSEATPAEKGRLAWMGRGLTLLLWVPILTMGPVGIVLGLVLNVLIHFGNNLAVLWARSFRDAALEEGRPLESLPRLVRWLANQPLAAVGGIVFKGRIAQRTFLALVVVALLVACGVGRTVSQEIATTTPVAVVSQVSPTPISIAVTATHSPAEQEIQRLLQSVDMSAYPSEEGYLSQMEVLGAFEEGIRRIFQVDPAFGQVFSHVDGIRFSRTTSDGRPFQSARLFVEPDGRIMIYFNPDFYAALSSPQSPGGMNMWAILQQALGREPTQRELLQFITWDFMAVALHEGIHALQEESGALTDESAAPLIEAMWNVRQGDAASLRGLTQALITGFSAPRSSAQDNTTAARREWEAYIGEFLIRELYLMALRGQGQLSEENARLYSSGHFLFMPRHSSDPNPSGTLFNGVVSGVHAGQFEAEKGPILMILGWLERELQDGGARQVFFTELNSETEPGGQSRGTYALQLMVDGQWAFVRFRYETTLTGDVIVTVVDVSGLEVPASVQISVSGAITELPAPTPTPGSPKTFGPDRLHKPLDHSTLTFEDAYEVGLDLSLEGAGRFARAEGRNEQEPAEAFSRMLADGLNRLEEITRGSALEKYVRELLGREDNRGPPASPAKIRVRVSGNLPVNAVRYFNAETGQVEIIFSKVFVDTLLQDQTQFPEAVSLILAERLFHELGHTNRDGTVKQEQKEERRLIKQDLAFNRIVRAKHNHAIRAYFSQPRRFRSGYYFKFLAELEGLSRKDREKRIDSYLEENYPEYVAGRSVKAMASTVTPRDIAEVVIEELRDAGYFTQMEQARPVDNIYRFVEAVANRYSQGPVHRDVLTEATKILKKEFGVTDELIRYAQAYHAAGSSLFQIAQRLNFPDTVASPLLMAKAMLELFNARFSPENPLFVYNYHSPDRIQLALQGGLLARDFSNDQGYEGFVDELARSQGITAEEAEVRLEAAGFTRPLWILMRAAHSLGATPQGPAISPVDLIDSMIEAGGIEFSLKEFWTLYYTAYTLGFVVNIRGQDQEQQGDRPDLQDMVFTALGNVTRRTTFHDEAYARLRSDPARLFGLFGFDINDPISLADVLAQVTENKLRDRKSAITGERGQKGSESAHQTKRYLRDPKAAELDVAYVVLSNPEILHAYLSTFRFESLEPLKQELSRTLVTDALRQHNPQEVATARTIHDLLTTLGFYAALGKKSGEKLNRESEERLRDVAGRELRSKRTLYEFVSKEKNPTARKEKDQAFRALMSFTMPDIQKAFVIYHLVQQQRGGSDTAGSWFGEDYERFVLDPALRAFFSLHARVWDDMVDSLAGWGLNRNAAEALRAAQDMDDAVALLMPHMGLYELTRYVFEAAQMSLTAPDADRVFGARIQKTLHWILEEPGSLVQPSEVHIVRGPPTSIQGMDIHKLLSFTRNADGLPQIFIHEQVLHDFWNDAETRQIAQRIAERKRISLDDALEEAFQIVLARALLHEILEWKGLPHNRVAEELGFHPGGLDSLKDLRRVYVQEDNFYVEDQSVSPFFVPGGPRIEDGVAVNRVDLRSLPRGTLVHFQIADGHWDYTIRVEGEGKVSIWLGGDAGRIGGLLGNIGAWNRAGEARITSPQGVLDISKNSFMPYFHQTEFNQGQRQLVSAGWDGFNHPPQNIRVLLPEPAAEAQKEERQREPQREGKGQNTGFDSGPIATKHGEAQITINREIFRALSSDERKLFLRLLREDNQEIMTLVREYKDTPNPKIYIAYDEYNDPENGRTVYFRLDRPAVINGRRIQTLKIKGIRLRLDPDGKTYEHAGKGKAAKSFVPDASGKISVVKHGQDPQGALTSAGADREFDVMMEGLASGYPTDYPVGKGHYADIEGVGFVISGLESDDLRLTKKQTSFGGFVIDQMDNGARVPMTSKQSMAFSYSLGQALRKYHDAGNFHRYLHLGNIGVQVTAEGDYLPIIRDLDPTVKVSDLGEGVTMEEVIGYRFVDIWRAISEIQIFVERNVTDGMIEQFVYGYFADFSRGDLYEVVDECINHKYSKQFSDNPDNTAQYKSLLNALLDATKGIPVELAWRVEGPSVSNVPPPSLPSLLPGAWFGPAYEEKVLTPVLKQFIAAHGNVWEAVVAALEDAGFAGIVGGLPQPATVDKAVELLLPHMGLYELTRYVFEIVSDSVHSSAEDAEFGGAIEGSLATLEKEVGVQIRLEDIQIVRGPPTGAATEKLLGFTEDQTGRLKIFISPEVLQEFQNGEETRRIAQEQGISLEKAFQVILIRALLHEVLEAGGMSHENVQRTGFRTDGLASLNEMARMFALLQRTELGPLLREGDVGVDVRLSDTEVESAVALRRALELAIFNRRLGPPADETDRRTREILATHVELAYLETFPPDLRGQAAVQNDLLEELRSLRAQGATEGQVAHRIAEAFGFEDAEAVRRAARILPMALPTEVLHTRGGDGRSAIDPKTGKTAYGNAAKPTPDVKVYSSSTSSPPTREAFERMERVRQDLLEQMLSNSGGFGAYFESRMADVRRRILQVLGLEKMAGVTAVTTPSATDVELIPLMMAANRGKPVRNLVLTETGSGTKLAAGGLYIDDQAPDGTVVKGRKGKPIPGFPAQTTQVTEMSADASDLDRQVEDYVRANIGESTVIVHLVVDSKTGLTAPQFQTIAKLSKEYGDDLMVVVDAAQGRIEPRFLQDYLDRGWIVFSSGSKFWGGVPFSGVAVIPERLRKEFMGLKDVPEGLGEFLTAADLPADVPWRDRAGGWRNASLLLRWEAALFEMEAFLYGQGEQDEITREIVLRGVIQRWMDGVRELMDRKKARTGRRDAVEYKMTGRGSTNTIVSFNVKDRHGNNLAPAQLKKLHAWLHQDVSALLPKGAADWERDVAARKYLLGQPVDLTPQEKDESMKDGVLRITLGAPLARQLADQAGPDLDQDRVEKALEQEMEDVRVLLLKIQMIVRRWDAVERAEEARRPAQTAAVPEPVQFVNPAVPRPSRVDRAPGQPTIAWDSTEPAAKGAETKKSLALFPEDVWALAPFSQALREMGIVQEPEDLVIAVRVNQPGLIDFRFYDKRGVYIVNLQLSTEDGGQTAWLGHIEPSFVRAKLNSLPPGEREAFQQQWREMTQDWLLTRVRPWLQGRGFTEWRVRPKAGTEPGKGDGFLLGIGFQWPPNGELHFMSQRLEGPTEAGQALGMAGGLGGLANRLAARTGRPLRDFIRLFAHGEEQFMGLVFVGLITIGLGVLFRAIGLDPSLPFLALLSGFPVALRQPLFRFLHRGDLYFVKETEVGTELVRGPPTAKQRQQLWRASGRFSETFFVSTLVLSGVFLLFDLLLQSYGISIHAHVWFLAAAALAGVRAGRTHARYNLSTEGPLAVPTVGTDRDLWPPDLTPDMPASGLIHALFDGAPIRDVQDLSSFPDGSPLNGATLKRVSIEPSGRLPASGLETLYYQLGIDNRDGTSHLPEALDLLYDDTGRLVALFPVFPDGETPSIPLVDLVHYYHDARLLKGLSGLGPDEFRERVEEINRSWTEFRKSTNRAFMTIRRYVDAKRWSDLVFDTARNALTHSEHVYARIDIANADRDMDIVSDMSPLGSRLRYSENGHQVLFPVFPTVYSPEKYSNQSNDDGFYRALLGKTKARFNINPDEDSKTLVVGTGSGMDSLIAALQTKGEIWVTDINPFAVESVRHLFRLAGIEHRLRTFVMDNVADERGNPRLLDGDGRPVQFDRVVWNMPIHSARPMERKDMRRARGLWDGVGPEVLQRFAGVLPRILKTDGMALVWNHDVMDNLGNNEVEMAFRTAGSYLGLSPEARETRGPFLSDTLSFPMAVERIGQRELGSNGKFPPYVIKHATAEGREDAEPVKDEMLLNYARRAALTQDDYEKLIRTGREDVMLALAERADAPEWVLRDLAGVGGKKLMSMLCKHPSLPPDVLLDMALRGEPFVRTMSMSSPAATFASLLVVHALGGQAGFKEAKDVIPDEKRYGALGDLLLRLSGPLTQALSGLPEAQRSWGNIPPNVKAELEELLRLEPVFQAAARLPADRWKNFGSTGNLGQDLSKLTAFVEISGGGQHPLGQDDFTAQEKEELLKNAWQSGARFLADDESFRAGLASEVRDILMAEPGSPAEPVLSLPQMRESVEALMDYLRQGPGAPVTIGGRAYDVRFHYTRDAAPFRTASGREAGAFTAIDGNTIHVYARDLPGLLHESLEFLVFPQNAAVSNDRRQHHTLAFFAEALVRGAPVRGGVAMPGRAFREVDRMTDEAVLRGFVEGYEAARAQLREKFSGQPEYLRYGLTLAEAMHSRARRNAEDLAESQEIFDRFMDNLRGIQPGQPAYEEAQKLLRFREQLTTETAVLSTALSAARHFHGDIQSMGLEDVLGNTRNWLEVFDEELNRASMISARSAAGLRMRKDIREVLMTDGAAVLSMHYLRERWRSGDIDRDVMDSLFTYTWQDWFQSRTDDRDLRARFGRILREVKFSVSLRRTMARVLYPRHGRIVRVTPLDGEALRGRRRLFVSTKDLLSLQSALRMLNALVDMLDPGKIRAGDRFVVYELPGAGTDGLGIKQQNDVFGYELANNLIQMRREKLKALMQEEFGGRVTLVMPIYDNFKENTFDLRMEVTGSLSSVQMREGLDRVRQRLRAEMTEEMRRGRFREALAAKRDLLRSYGITDIDAQNLFEVRFGFADVAEATDEERLAADIQAHQAMNFEEQEYSREAYEGLIGNLTRLSGELEREAPGIFRPVQDPELGEELVLRDEVVTHLRKQHAWEDLPAADRALFRDDPRVYRLAGELFRRLKIQDYIKKWNLDFATAADEAAVVREGVQSLSLFAEAHRDREMLPDKAVKPLRGIFRKTQRYLWGDPKNRRATSVHGFHSAAPFMSRPVYINIDVRNMGGMNITQFQLEVKRIKRALDRGDWEEVSRIQRSAADEVTRNFLRMQQIVAEEYQRVREAHQAAGKPSDQLVDGSRMVLADGRMLKGRELAEYLKTHPGAGQPLVSLVGGDEYTAVVDGRLLKGRALYEFLFRVRDRIREEAHIDIRLSVSALAPFFRYKHFRRGHLADHLAHAEVILRADDQTDVLKKAEKLRQQGHNVPDMIVVDGLDESGEEPIRFGIVQGRKGQPVRYDLAPVLQQAAIRPRQAMAAFAAATLPAGLLLALSAGLQLLTGQALDVAALIPILLAPVFLMALVWLASALGWAAKALGIRAGPVDAARLVPFLQEAQDDPSVAFFEVQNGVLKVNPAVKKFLSLLPQPVQNLILYGLGIVGHEVSHLRGHGELYAYGLTQILPAFGGSVIFGGLAVVLGVSVGWAAIAAILGAFFAVGVVGTRYARNYKPLASQLPVSYGLASVTIPLLAASVIMLIAIQLPVIFGFYLIPSFMSAPSLISYGLMGLSGLAIFTYGKDAVSIILCRILADKEKRGSETIKISNELMNKAKDELGVEPKALLEEELNKMGTSDWFSFGSLARANPEVTDVYLADWLVTESSSPSFNWMRKSIYSKVLNYLKTIRLLSEQRVPARLSVFLARLNWLNTHGDLLAGIIILVSIVVLGGEMSPIVFHLIPRTIVEARGAVLMLIVSDVLVISLAYLSLLPLYLMTPRNKSAKLNLATIALAIVLIVTAPFMRKSLLPSIDVNGTPVTITGQEGERQAGKIRAWLRLLPNGHVKDIDTVVVVPSGGLRFGYMPVLVVENDRRETLYHEMGHEVYLGLPIDRVNEWIELHANGDATVYSRQYDYGDVMARFNGYHESFGEGYAEYIFWPDRALYHSSISGVYAAKMAIIAEQFIETHLGQPHLRVYENRGTSFQLVPVHLVNGRLMPEELMRALETALPQKPETPPSTDDFQLNYWAYLYWGHADPQFADLVTEALMVSAEPGTMRVFLRDDPDSNSMVSFPMDDAERLTFASFERGVQAHLLVGFDVPDQGDRGQPIKPQQAALAALVSSLPALGFLAAGLVFQTITGQALDFDALLPVLSILLAPVSLMGLLWFGSWAIKALGQRAGPAEEIDQTRLVPFLQEAQDDPSVAFFEVQNGVLKVNPAVKKFLSLLPQPVQNLILYGLGIVGHEVSHLRGHGELYAYGLTQILPAFGGSVIFGGLAVVLGVGIGWVVAAAGLGAVALVGGVGGWLVWRQARSQRPYDPRPVEAGLLNEPHARLDAAIRDVVNPGNQEDKTAVYGGAGVDVSNFLMATNATTAYFVSQYRGSLADLKNLRNYRGKAHPDYKQKYNKGYAEGYWMGSDEQVLGALALELEAIGVDLDAVEVDSDDGHPRLRFRWRYPGAVQRDYSITFIDADIVPNTAEPGARKVYNPKLEDVYKKGIDLYYQRAGMGISREYESPDSFIYDVYDALRPGGYFVTDDYTNENSVDLSGSFPVKEGVSEVEVPGFAGMRRAILEAMLAAELDLDERTIDEIERYGWFHYGWHLRIRQKGPSAAPAAQPVPKVVKTSARTERMRRDGYRQVLREILIGKDQIRPWTPYVDRGWVHRVQVEPVEMADEGLAQSRDAFQNFTQARNDGLAERYPQGVSPLKGADVRDVMAHQLGSRAAAGLKDRNLTVQDVQDLAVLLATLHGLGGSLTQSWETSDREQGLTPAQRAEYQRLDWEWFVQIPVLMGRDNFAEIEQAYNAARRQALSSGQDSVFHALDQALAVDGPVAVEVSERLLGEDLTPQEESTLHLLRGLFARLSEDPELLARKQVVLVADGWKRGDMLAALAERAGLGPVVAARLREAAGIRTLDARAEGAMAGDRISVQAVMRLLRMGKNQGMDIFAMDQKNWDTTGVEHLVNLLLVLSGDLVKNAASGIGEAIEKMEFIKIQA